MDFHEIKVEEKYYKDVASGIKTFELIKLDRDYKVGDVLVLHEFQGEVFTGRLFTVKVTYIFKDFPGFGLMDGYGILGIVPLEYLVYY